MTTHKESILSLSDCCETIRNYLQSNSFTVTNYKVKPFSDGFMGNHHIITITFLYEGAEKAVRFYAKRVPLQDELPSCLGVFANEIITYDVLFNKFKKFSGFTTDFTATYYYGKEDLLLLEDLSERQFGLPEHTNALPLDHIEKSLELLARFHCGSIGYQEIKSRELGRKYSLLEDYEACMQEPLFRHDETFVGYRWFKARLSALNALIDLSPHLWKIAPVEFKSKLRELVEQSFEIMKPNKTFYSVLCHGDMCAKNVMFRYDNGELVECKLVNFQLQRYCFPAHDVLQFLYLVMSAEARKRHLHALLRYYYERLRGELLKGDLDLNEIIPYADFELSVNYLLPQIKLQTAYCYTLQGANPSSTLNVDDFKKIVFDDGAPFALDLFKTDANYRRLMTEALTELMDFITHYKITTEDCYKIIEKKLKSTTYDSLQYSLVRLTNVSGFLGDHYKLKINLLVNNTAKTLNMFAKCAPASKTRFDLGVSAGVFLKEAFVLETLIPSIRKVGVEDIEECVVPHYILRINDVIVFDDLTFAAFHPASQRVPFTFDDLVVVVKKLAVYHASNIALEEKLSKRNGYTFRLSRFKDAVKECFFRTQAHNFSSLSIKLGVETVPFQIELFFDLDYPDGFLKKVEKAFEACYELIKPSPTYRNVVCHGDLWADNIMMKYENDKPTDCRIIDYQITRYCPPAHDLLTLLHLTTTRAVRAQHLQKLIDTYYERFATVLKNNDCNVDDIYTYAAFIESCNVLLPQAVCQTVVFYHFTMTNPEFMRDYIQDEELTRKIFLEDRRDFVRDMCERDPVYKSRMRESLLDLKEMCLKYF